MKFQRPIFESGVEKKIINLVTTVNHLQKHCIILHPTVGLTKPFSFNLSIIIPQATFEINSDKFGRAV